MCPWQNCPIRFHRENACPRGSSMATTKHVYLILRLLSPVWICVTGGCAAHASPSSASGESRACGFYNATNIDLASVAFMYAKGERTIRFSAGYLSPHTTKVTHPAFGSIPGNGVVHWRTPDKKMHQQEVQVAAHVPGKEQFSGTIYFVFEDNEWVVKTMSKEESDQRARTGRYSRPDVPGTGPDIPADLPPEPWLRSIQTPDRPAGSDQKYDPYLFAFLNATDHPISEVKGDVFLNTIPGSPIMWIRHTSTLQAGEAIADHWHSWALEHLTHVKITWQDANGDRHHQQFPLASQIIDAKNFSGIVWLVFSDSGWVVRTRSFQSGRERAKAGRGDAALPDLIALSKAGEGSAVTSRPTTEPVQHPAGRYAWAYYNATTRPIHQIELRNGRDAWASFQTIPPKQSMRGSWAVRPLETQQRVTVTWRDDENDTHQAEVPVADQLQNPVHFEGIIWIKFTGQGVKMIPMTLREIQERQKNKRPIEPEE